MANLGQIPVTMEIPQNLSTNRIEPNLSTNRIEPNFQQNLPMLSIPKESKPLFEPEINVKTEEPSAQIKTDNFDKFIKKAKKIDPLLLWGVLRPKILNNVTLWDYLVDRTVLQAQSVPVGNVPSERLKILLNELQLLINLVTEAVHYCCESRIKTEEAQNNGETGPHLGIDDIIVPDKLMSILGVTKNPVTLKANTDFAKYERLFALDESLKPVSVFLIHTLPDTKLCLAIQ